MSPDLRYLLLNRREALSRTAVGFGSLALASLLTETSRAASSDAETSSDVAHHAPRAKRVIFLFMKGGPSHLDTFDYKPKLQKDHGKELPFAKPRVQFAKTGKLLASPWSFSRYGQSGMLVSELFPSVAKHVDKMCFLHSVHGTNAAHGGACLKLHTGSDNFVRPSMGSWVSYGLGTETRDLPSFVTICPTLAHGGVNNWGAAFLPAAHQGSPLGVASRPAKEATLKYARSSKSSRVQRLQLDFLKGLDSEAESAVADRVRSFELAFRMQRAMPEALSITSESEATKKLYGLDQKVTEDFGLQCLLARRLVERGVRFVQVSHSDTNVQWDQHDNLRKGHTKNAREIDVPIGGLLSDLESRGLLEDTLVLWGGEFGRTPVAQGNVKDGRDHNPEGFTMWMAGGGVKGGFRYGATDEYGYYAAENKMHVHDLHATLLHALGLNHERLTFRFGGRDFRLTDVSGSIAHEIFA
ncbi:MAG: DUF1501 domain-containing protein [Planctomycetota bacterium]